MKMRYAVKVESCVQRLIDFGISNHPWIRIEGEALYDERPLI